MKKSLFSALVASWLVTAAAVQADEAGGNAQLAQELTNPLAKLITIPIQMNFDNDIGPGDDGSKVTTNIQPVIPFEFNENWNLITRSIVPIVSQDDVFPGSGSQFGLGDSTLTLFMSPKQSADKGVIWGVGPVFLLPTATDSKLGTKKWGIGPSAVVVVKKGPWTYGMLGNHIWSFAGDEDRDDISNSFLQPFVSYTWPNAWIVSLQSESSYDWKSEAWSVPVNFTVGKLVKFGKLPVSLGAGVGYWLESPDNGPEGLRFRLLANIVLHR